MMNRWKAILAVLVIFIAGFSSGAMASRLLQKPAAVTPPVVPGGPAMPYLGERLEFMRRMTSRLGLAPEQNERIEKLVRESQQRVRELWAPVSPKVQEELRALRRQIEAELTPEQNQRFEEMSKERPSRGSSDHRRKWDGSGGPKSTNGPPPGFRPPGPAPKIGSPD